MEKMMTVLFISFALTIGSIVGFSEYKELKVAEKAMEQGYVQCTPKTKDIFGNELTLKPIWKKTCD